jgi:hypothetical protein
MFLVILGVLIAIGAALAFIAIGALTLYGGADATQRQVVPGFRPDNPGGAERVLTFIGLWGSIIFVAALCIYAGIHILQVAFAAL